MQEILFRDSPYLVTAYNTIGQAVRSDRFACLLNQPQPERAAGSSSTASHNYRSIRPAAEAGDCDGSTSATQASESSGRVRHRAPVSSSAPAPSRCCSPARGPCW